MWFGTSDGLTRYDGTNFYVYENDPADSNSLNHNTINTIIEDKSNNIWIGTPGGLNLYSRETNNFINVNAIPENTNHLNSEFVNALYAHDDGRIWIGTLGGGLNIYDPKKFTFEYYVNNINDSNSISSNSVTEIAADAENNIWIGTRSGLNLFLNENKNFKRFYYDPANQRSLSHNHIHSLALDANKNFWIGTRGGLNKMISEKEAGVFKRYHHDPNKPGSLSNNYILSLSADRNNLLWIGTENGGLNCLNIDSDSINIYYNEEGNPNSISSNSIWSLYTDDENILWIGVYSKGVNIVNEKSRKFKLYQRNVFLKNTLSDDDVRGFAEDKDGNVWIATDGGGICRFDPKTRQFTKTISHSENKKLLSNNAVMSILYDSKDNLWIGTWTGGIDLLNAKGVKIRNYKIQDSQAAGINHIVTLYGDSYGNIWAGTSGNGLFRYNASDDQFVKFVSNNPDIPSRTAYITSLLEDTDKTLWVGTLYGLLTLERTDNGSYEGKVIYRTNTPGSISSNGIEIIYEDSKNRLWFGAGDKGLNLFNKADGTFTTYQKQDGMPNNSIRGIVEDTHGFLWISTNKGLSRFDPESGVFRNFSKEDGLNSDEFYVRSCMRARSGEIYFGGTNGFNTFYPHEIKDNKYIPPVYITDLKVNGKQIQSGVPDSPLQKHISATTSITLTHEQRSFSIDFVALNYTHSLKNKYKYKLDGFDKDWNYADTDRSATYTNIDPGEYIFFVKGSNNDGRWNETPATLAITIKPPVWKTWWAILLYVLLFSTLLLISIRIRLERIRINNELKLERMAREKEHELSQLKMQFFTNISHEFRTPLSLIIAPLDGLISSPDAPVKIKEQLSVTYQNARRMMRLVNELMDFRKLDEGKVKLKAEHIEITKFISTVAANFTDIAKKRNITFTIETNAPSITGWIDKDKLETIVFNLLANAFKFVNENGKISVIISMQNNCFTKNNNGSENETCTWLELIVTDNGIGISAEELPHIFDKFYQAKSADIKKTGGTGIGLALTKGLVELHHGSISVESTPGHDTHFTIRLPIDQHAYSADELYEAPADKAEGTPQVDNEVTIAEEEIMNDSEKSQILVVEDNDQLREYLVNELSRNFIVTQAADGRKGVEEALNKIPDLIVSDIVMPEKSGIELCRELKSDIRTSHIPIILLTARTSVEDQIEGIGTGADAYLPKPFNIRLLKVQVKQLIEIRRKLYAAFSQDVYMIPARMTDNEIDQAFLQKAIDYIVEHITDTQLNVEALADMFKISRSQVYRKIKALTGKTAVEFIRTIRLKQALKLMETKKHTLAEIAYQTGFTSPSYFTRSFKEQYGKAPSEYLGNNA